MKYCKSFFVGIIFLITSSSAFSQTNPNFNYIIIKQKLLEYLASKNSNTIDSEAAIYQQIANEFQLEYENIGRREALAVLKGNGTSITGGLNSIGFSYRKPFIDFGVTVDRNLAPDLFDSTRWIVTDTFNIEIDASKILGNLRDQGAIDMTEENFGAFAGIVFKRKFTWIHYAKSYEDGLMGSFEKLFLPFTGIKFSNLSKLSANEMIFKEDSISLKAGGMVTAPLYNGVTGLAGVLAKYERLSRVEVIALDKTTLQISSEKTKVATSGINLSVQAEFLNFLRLTLLSYDFNYELDSSYKIYLSLPSEELKSMPLQDPVAMEIQQILKNREGDLDSLTPYVISEEKRISQSLAHKYNFLIFGGQKASKTQQIEITKDKKVKNFFRHYYERIKYTENWLSRLFTSVVNSFKNSDNSALAQASDTKKVVLEYDSERNLLDNREELFIGNKVSGDQKISMTFTSDFKTQTTSGLSGDRYRQRAKFILDRFSGVDPIAVSMIENESLKAPYHIEGHYQIDADGIRYLNTLKINTVFDYFDGLCSESPKSGFINFRNLFDNCRRNLQNDYIDYFKDLTYDKVTADEIEKCEDRADKYFLFPGKKRSFIKNCLASINKLPEAEWVYIPLWPLKNLSNNIVNNSYSKVHFFNLFGVQNVFFYGRFDAKNSDGSPFSTSFHEGAFKGLGAVDHYMRKENLRAPSSVVVDQ